MFTGSFDPFTIGHHSIVKRLTAIFDKVVIGVGINESKQYSATIGERVENIRQLYRNHDNIDVVAFDDCAVDLAKRTHADCIVKGVRNVKDFEYERNQADINRLLGGVETMLIMAEPQLASISSSVVRELKAFGKPVDRLVPTPDNIDELFR